MILRKPMGGNLSINIPNLSQLQDFSALLAPLIRPGEAISLCGNLGSGKTTFVQAFCKALGVTQKVTSPTFTLLNEYTSTSLTVLHGDLYRLETSELTDFLPELEARMAEPNTITFIEWADKAPLMACYWTWTLDFKTTGETTRVIAITGPENRLEQLRITQPHG